MMDSRLLNVFHDDPFDGNYVKYENDADFWTSGGDTMSLQLTETLHGILPIASTEDTSVIYDNTILKDDYVIDSRDDAVAALQTKNALMLADDDFSEHMNDTTVGAVEIVTVDPNAEDSDDFNLDSEDEELLQEIDNQSQYSNGTFRSRTDSSSIGDYESHTSDYDDDDYEDYKYAEFINNNVNESLSVLPKDQSADTSKTIHFLNDSSFKLPEDATRNNKNRTLSINTTGSDVDGLGLQIDANTFDLAEFITQDDFALAAATSCSRNVEQPTNSAKQNTPVQVITPENDDSDTDSDVIVDVETIDAEAEKRLWLEQSKQNLNGEYQQVEVPFVDNLRDDPSWSPTVHIKKETISKEIKKTVQSVSVAPISQSNQSNLNRSFSLVPSKRQCDFLKGKFGSGRGKMPAMQRCTKSVNTIVLDTKLENTKTLKMEINENNALRNQIAPISNKRKVGVGQGGKNLALIKHERHSISEQSSEDNVTSPNKDPRTQLLSVQKEENETIVPFVKKATVKRKLNLEEYKQRRGENSVCSENLEKSKIPKVEKEENIADVNVLPKQNHCPTKAATSSVSCTTPTTPAKHSEAVTLIVKSLKGEAKPKQNLDPITEAKNKVLRMQELKKAQLLKIIDSTVSAKVPRVTKVLPLKDIMKDSYNNTDADTHANNRTVFKSNSDYEEIVIVSASCNTDISIPPIHILPNATFDTAALKNVTNNASRSLLKSSALLYNITNTFQKVQATDNIKLSTNSLIVSIQDVVVKQTTPTVEHVVNNHDGHKLNTTTNRNSNINKAATVIFEKNAVNSEQHGEDKIIMHLRKDRIRQRTISASIQTDILPEFPPLPMPKFQRRPRERRRQKHTRAKRHVNSAANSISCDDSSCSSDDHSRSYRSRSRSCSSSTEERLRRSGTTGGSSLTSSSRHHRSSLSSSYSESERNLTRRNRKSNYKQRAKRFTRSSSNSSSDYSDRRSRTRSRSPIRRNSHNNINGYTDRNVSQPAVEERRIVYVGRIEQETSKEMLRRKFISYGPIKQITIHYKDTGMKYGFVTYERPQDAFAVIDNGARDAHINMYDISFGGRRAFCRASYADLDNAGINTYHSYVFPKVVTEPKEEDSFEALLLKVKAKITANKTTTSTDTSETSKNNI